MSISNNNAGVNANQNNQSLAAEGVVERGRFVISILADIYTYTYVWKCSRSTSGTCPFSFSLLLYSKTTNNDSLSIFIIYNIEFNVPIMYFLPIVAFFCAMPVKIRWMRVHKINYRDQKIKRLEHIKTMNTL